MIYACVFALPFVLIRIAYSTSYIFSQKPNLNPVTGLLSYRLTLGYFPELVVVVALVLVGLATRDVARKEAVEETWPGLKQNGSTESNIRGDVETVGHPYMGYAF